jgi:hypothetical protein
VNPMLQQLMPGLGQPMNFNAMAQGQGLGLADALQGSRQQNTLANAPTLGNAQAME